MATADELETVEVEREADAELGVNVDVAVAKKPGIVPENILVRGSAREE